MTCPRSVRLSTAGAFYRFRIGDYRIGVAIEGSEVVLVRCLHRREVYRYFP
ncbi:MAG: type II toxin-antitoxin system RelE/ParE family toxin [bacterium]|nr:type II toxin-antitoxin system RelE/ParE family toxin [bacterium]